jgi:hypothetical protein
MSIRARNEIKALSKQGLLTITVITIFLSMFLGISAVSAVDAPTLDEVALNHSDTAVNTSVEKVEAPTLDEVTLNLTSGIKASLDNQEVVDFLADLDTVTIKRKVGEIEWVTGEKILVVYIDAKTLTVNYVFEKEIKDQICEVSAGKTWHYVATFHGCSRDCILPPFAIKGDRWQLYYMINANDVKAEDSVFVARVYPESIKGPGKYISIWQAPYYTCYGYDPVYSGEGNFYIKIVSRYNNWAIVVKDYY